MSAPVVVADADLPRRVRPPTARRRARRRTSSARDSAEPAASRRRRTDGRATQRRSHSDSVLTPSRGTRRKERCTAASAAAVFIRATPGCHAVFVLFDVALTANCRQRARRESVKPSNLCVTQFNLDVYLWSPYVIGRPYIFSSCDFYLSYGRPM